jgi:hypothetical protein
MPSKLFERFRLEKEHWAKPYLSQTITLRIVITIVVIGRILLGFTLAKDEN